MSNELIELSSSEIVTKLLKEFFGEGEVDLLANELTSGITGRLKRNRDNRTIQIDFLREDFTRFGGDLDAMEQHLNEKICFAKKLLDIETMQNDYIKAMQ